MRAVRPILLLLVLALPGCGSLLTEGTADVAGIVGAGAASSVTRSAAGAAAIGLAVTSLASEGLRHIERRVHAEEQDAIATVAGPMEPGAVAHWAVSHRVPIEDDEQGDVSVARTFGYGPIACKEVMFSVETLRRRAVERAVYVTTICRDDGHWRWATAEPATGRWGALQ